ncbi:MAG: formylglycine-generating enzyme family protein [Ardenticatenaceae bacterium]|nr:formylglycine-generating enzyme family protein [Ardenticatenaceae bacterium]
MSAESKNIVELIRLAFDEEELKELVYDLEFDFEDLPASLGKSGKVLELVRIFEQNGRLPQLVTAAREHRPHLEWPDTSHPFSPAELYGESTKPFLDHEPARENMLLIPAGPFLMGSQPGENIPSYEQPQHEVDLPAYYLCQYPVTNAQYAEFIKATKHPKPEKVGWFGLKPPAKKMDHPVVGVSWNDAQAYCKWLSEQTGRPYRLPTEAEWEKAARGTDGRLYPWGNEWEASRCNSEGSETTAVTAHPTGASPYGCLDMAGNASEWTTTLWGDNISDCTYLYPYRAKDGRENLEAEGTVYRIFRGGSYESSPAELRCAARNWYVPDNKDRRRSFRLALSHF